jgi:hypothetical protein
MFSSNQLCALPQKEVFQSIIGPSDYVKIALPVINAKYINANCTRLKHSCYKQPNNCNSLSIS